MSSVLTFVRRRQEAVRLFYSIYSPPTLKLKTVVNKSKQACVIKNLHRENKEIFGDLLESTREKKSKSKKSIETAYDSHETDLVPMTQKSGDSKAAGKNESNQTVVNLHQLQIDFTYNVSQNQSLDKELPKTAETTWMVKTFSQRVKLLRRIPPLEHLTKKTKENNPVESQLFTSAPLSKKSSKKISKIAKQARDPPTLKQVLISLHDCQDINQFGEVKIVRKDVSVERKMTGEELDTNLESVIIHNAHERNASGTNETYSDVNISTPDEAEAITMKSKGINSEIKISSHSSSDPNPIRVSDGDTLSAGYKLFPLDNTERSSTNETTGIESAPHIISLPFPTEPKSILNSNTRYPSVTRVLTATMTPEQVQILKKWEQKMIRELGEDGFREYKEQLFRNGKELHTNLQSLLSGKPVEQIEISAPIVGHWKSLQPILCRIEKVSVLESYVSHPKLGYSGIIDCIATYREKLVLIDWKTSEKPKPFISNTYDTPLQIAAYMGAINYDPKYTFKVNEGLVVIAYKDGNDCQVFSLTSHVILKYWKLWLQRLKLYQTKQNLSE